MPMIIWGIFDGMLSTIVSCLFLLTVVVTIIVVVLDNRNPVKTLAWVLVLCFLPIVGLIFYFFFGRDVRKEKMISKKGFARLAKYPMMEFQMQESFKTSEEKTTSADSLFSKSKYGFAFCWKFDKGLPGWLFHDTGIACID